MRKKVLLSILVVALTVVVFCCTAFSSFAFVSRLNTPSAVNMPYLSILSYDDSTSQCEQLVLNGYVSEDGSVYSTVTGSYGDSARTYRDFTNNTIGYSFTLWDTSEIFINFSYLNVNNFDVVFELEAIGESSFTDYTVSLGYFADMPVQDFFFEQDTVHLEPGYFTSIYDLCNDCLSRETDDGIFEQIGSVCGISYLCLSFPEIKSSDSGVTGTIYITDASRYFSDKPYYHSSYTIRQMGFSAGQDFVESAGSISDAYERGYNAGYSNGMSEGENNGYSHGFDAGYVEGSDMGYSSGYSSGLLEGREEGYDSGLSDGKTAGLTEGYNNGYIEGKTDGYQEGVDKGIEDIGLFAYIVRSISSFMAIPLGDYFTLGGVFGMILPIPIIIAVIKFIRG